MPSWSGAALRNPLPDRGPRDRRRAADGAGRVEECRRRGLRRARNRERQRRHRARQRTRVAAVEPQGVSGDHEACPRVAFASTSSLPPSSWGNIMSSATTAAPWSRMLSDKPAHQGPRPRPPAELFQALLVDFDDDHFARLLSRAGPSGEQVADLGIQVR